VKTTAVANLPLRHFTGWLANGERGISSEAIVEHLTGNSIGRGWKNHDHPHDPDDFRRCQRLFERVPIARLWLPTLASRSPQWARLVEAWDEIHATCEAEVPGYIEGARGSASKAYMLMRRTIEGGTACETCDGTGNGEACEKCKGTGRRCGGRCRARYCHRGYRICDTCRGRGYTGGDDS
jgi:hypothetical protein